MRGVGHCQLCANVCGVPLLCLGDICCRGLRRGGFALRVVCCIVVEGGRFVCNPQSWQRSEGLWSGRSLLPVVLCVVCGVVVEVHCRS